MSLYIAELRVSLCFVNNVYIPYFNVTSGGIRCSKGTPIIKKIKPLPFYQRRNNERRGKTKVLTLNKYMAMSPRGGSMPGVTVLAGCPQ
jgi:hypothetical protein